jgi:hypothetical protein
LKNWIPFWVIVPVGRGRSWGKGVRGLICCKYCVHLHVNGKMIPVETIPVIGEG